MMIERRCTGTIDNRNAGRTAKFEIFKGMLVTWDKLFQEAADFTSEIGPERVIGISHSEDHNEGVVTVWYWE